MGDIDHRVYLLAGAALFVIGLYGLLAMPHLLRKILTLNVMGSGVFLVFIALAAETPGPVPDPVPQAMVLTGIVVSVCATGLALALADCVRAATGRADLTRDDSRSDDDEGGKGPPHADEAAGCETTEREHTGGHQT